jgi:hypothetical protein
MPCQDGQSSRAAARATGAIIEPTLKVLEAMRVQLRVYDRAITRRARGDDTARQLMSAPGVGTVVALAYMTAIEDPARFRRSSSVAAYLGMTPRRYQSGEVDHGGRISKCGDGMVRSLLFEAAKVLLRRPEDLGRDHWQTHRGQEGNDSGRAQTCRHLASHVDHRHNVQVGRADTVSGCMKFDPYIASPHLAADRCPPAGTGFDDRAILSASLCEARSGHSGVET